MRWELWTLPLGMINNVRCAAYQYRMWRMDKIACDVVYGVSMMTALVCAHPYNMLLTYWIVHISRFQNVITRGQQRKSHIQNDSIWCSKDLIERGGMVCSFAYVTNLSDSVTAISGWLEFMSWHCFGMGRLFVIRKRILPSLYGLQITWRAEW